MVWTEMPHPLDREHTLANLIRCRCRGGLRWSAGCARPSTTGAGGNPWPTGQDASGQHVRMMGTYSDISQRVEQAHLRRALLDQSSGHLLAAQTRTIRHANARAVEMFAKDGKTLRNLSFSQLHGCTNLRSIWQLLRHRAAMVEVRLEHPLRDAHGQIRWFDTHGTLLDPDRPDADVIWTLIGHDRERHQGRNCPAAERVRLTAIIDRFPAGVWVDE